MAICEFATIDSDKEMVVHGANLPEYEDFEWLAETLGVYPSDEMLRPLWLPKNETLVLLLFSQVHAKYHGMIPGEVIEVNENTIPETILRGPEQKMPDAGFIDPDAARWVLIALHARGENIGGWKLPRCDIWLPLTPTILSHLQHLVARGPSKNRCIDVLPPVFPSGTMNKLAELVAAAEAQVERLEEERASWATRRLALEYARRIVVLSAWQWTNAPRSQDKQAEMLVRLTALTIAITDLESAATRSSPAFEAERDAANALLAFLDPKSQAAKDIEEALEILAVQPNAFRSEQAQDVFDLLGRSFVVLARSSAAEEFVTQHFVSLVQAMAESLPPELEREFAEGYGEHWKSLWEVDWREAITALRSTGGVDEPSPYARLATMNQYYKDGLFVIQRTLNVSTLPILLGRLSDYAKTEAALKPLTDSLVTCMLRGLLATGAIHRGAEGGVLFAGKDVTKWFRACARALGDGPSSASMTEVARELKALKLEDAIKTTRIFASVSFVVSVISTMTAYDDTWNDSWQNWMKLYSAAIKTSEDLISLTGTLARQGLLAIEESGLNTLSAIGKRLGMMTAAISLVVAGGDALQNWSYMSSRKKLASAIATMSAAAALAALVPFVAASARWTSMIGPVGVVLAIAEFTVDKVISLTTADTEKLFLQYVQYAIAEGPYRQPGAARECASLMTATTAAKSAEALAKLGRLSRDPRDSKGVRDQIPDGESPTWFFAYSMGFPAEIVAKFFECDILDVVGAGIPLGPGYEEEGTAQPRIPTYPAEGASDASR
jgi:hypothetical protein